LESENTVKVTNHGVSNLTNDNLINQEIGEYDLSRWVTYTILLRVINVCNTKECVLN